MQYQQKVLVKRIGVTIGVVSFIAVNIFFAIMFALFGGDVYQNSKFLGNIMMTGAATWVVIVLLGTVAGIVQYVDYTDCAKDIARYGNKIDPTDWTSGKCLKYLPKK